MLISRKEAGFLLAQKLVAETETKEAVLLAIPNGGVVVADQISRSLGWPLALIVTKKITAPNNEELAIGAVGDKEDSVFLNNELITQLGIEKDYLDREINFRIAQVKRKQKELMFRTRPPLAGKKAIIIDDGIATGATVIAAIRQIRKESPDEVIVAAPVVSFVALEEIGKEADRVIYLESPKLFFSVSQFYQDFKQVSEEEVKRILATQE